MKRHLFPVLVMIAVFVMSAPLVQAQIRVSKDKAQDLETSIKVVEKEEVLDDWIEADRAVKSEVVEMPQPEQQNITIDYLAPLGSELLLLSCLGGAYLIGKRRKEK